MPTPSSQSGGIFTYILIGIVLFAALGYALSRNSIKTDFVSDEKARLLASEIINYGNQLRSAVSKLRLRGCKETQFDFSNSVYKTNVGAAINGGNTQSPSDDSCDLFAAAGGGLTPYVLPAEALDTAPLGPGYTNYGTFGAYQIMDVGTNGPGGTTSANEMIFGLAFVKPKICSAINQALGIAPAGATPPTPVFTGTDGKYINGDLSATGVMSHPMINGKLMFCRIASSNIHDFQLVLIPR